MYAWFLDMLLWDYLFKDAESEILDWVDWVVLDCLLLGVGNGKGILFFAIDITFIRLVGFWVG